MKALGIDWGKKHIGLSISRSGVLAAELTEISSLDAVDWLVKLAVREKIDTIVVGLPTTPQGLHGEQARIVKKFAAALGAKITVPIEFEDEAFTSNEANRLGGSHSLAARLLLEQWLNNSKIKN